MKRFFLRKYVSSLRMFDEQKNKPPLFFFLLAVSQILDSLEDIQWLTISDRVELNFLQKLFEDKQLRTLLEVRRSPLLLSHTFIA